MKTLLKATLVRQHLLDQASRTRHHKFSRVSKGAFDYLNNKLIEACDNLVASQPSKGVTIQPPYGRKGAEKTDDN